MATAVENKLFDSVCRQAGLVRAGTIEEAGIIATSFINRPLPRGKRVGIVTGGGGLGVIASDACSELGLEVVKLSSETLEKIGKLMPAWWVPGNPVDLVAGLNFATVMPIINILMKSGEVDAVMLLFIGPPRDSGQGPAVKTEQTERFRKMWKSMTGMFKAFGQAMAAARETGSLMPPKHILNAPTKLMKEVGYGDGYAYDHDTPEGFSGQDYFPEDMGRRNFYRPVERGFEREIVKRLDYWNRLRDGRKGGDEQS